MRKNGKSISSFVKVKSELVSNKRINEAFASSDSFSYSEGELKNLGVNFTNEYLKNKVTYGLSKNFNSKWSFGANVNFLDYRSINRDLNRIETTNEHKTLLLPDVYLMRKIHHMQDPLMIRIKEVVLY